MPEPVGPELLRSLVQRVLNNQEALRNEFEDQSRRINGRLTRIDRRLTRVEAALTKGIDAEATCKARSMS